MFVNETSYFLDWYAALPITHWHLRAEQSRKWRAVTRKIRAVCSRYALRRFGRSWSGMIFRRIVIPLYPFVEHDLRANASRLSRGKTGTHFSGSCSGDIFPQISGLVD
jgi:hypothetical protein